MKTTNELQKAISDKRAIYTYTPRCKAALTSYANALKERNDQRDHINDVINQVSM
mgnify:CR=1 FL=1|tara:strand:+ start:36 stop:200 length:165 start_codon:yes stop_codon:yes gene_type:complete